MNPVITVCLPVYNEQAFLRRSIESVLAQDLGDFTLHISDNGSSDATQQICEELSSQDSRIVYTRQPRNIGASANLAFMLRLVRTPFLMLMSGHDVLLPGCLSRLLALHAAHPQASLVYPTNVLIDPEDQISANSYCDWIDTRQLSRAQTTQLILTGMRGNMVYGMYKMKHLSLCNLGHVCRGCDHTLIYELSFLGDLIRCPEPLFGLRSMAGVNRPTVMNYRQFCRSQLQRLDPDFFAGGSRRVHWEWYAEHLRIAWNAPLGLLVRLRELMLMSGLFLWRWKRSLLEEVLWPLAEA